MGIYTEARPHKSCIASTCKVTGDTLWGIADMDVWVCVWLYIELQLPIHNLISSPQLLTITRKKNLSKIYYNSPLFSSHSPVAAGAPWKMCYLTLLTHLGHSWYMYWFYLLWLSQQSVTISRDGIYQSRQHCNPAAWKWIPKTYFQQRFLDVAEFQNRSRGTYFMGFTG